MYFLGANWDAVDKDGDTPLHFCMAGRRSSNLVSGREKLNKNLYHLKRQAP